MNNNTMTFADTSETSNWGIELLFKARNKLNMDIIAIDLSGNKFKGV